jgi:DNA helicase HerA-like ATPase
VVRLIRSKGVGVYFVTQNPLDVPETVLGQLGNRVQHALRAFTPRDQRAVRAAAETFRQNPGFDVASAITELGVGEALVSFLEAKGTPSIVERALIAPPQGRVGPLTPQERADLIAKSPLRGKYDEAVDRESAFEMLAKRKGLDAPEGAEEGEGGLSGMLGGVFNSVFGTPAPKKGQRRPPQSLAEQVLGNAVKSMARSVGKEVGNAILRNVLGGLTKR